MGHPARKLELVRQPEAPPVPRRRGFRLKLGRLAMTLIVGYFLALYGGQQVHIMRLQGEIEALTTQVAAAEEMRSELEARATYLMSDAYIEATARKELGLVLPGETVITGLR